MVNKLQGPLIKYTSGAFPTHSVTEKLETNFVGLDKLALRFILHKEGWMTSEGRPTNKAATDGLVFVLEKKALWDLKTLSDKLSELGNKFDRAPVNQEIKTPADGEPRWANLGTIATYFSVSANEVGKWLDSLELRGEDKMATDLATEQGLATVVEMSTGQGKNKTRKINHWNLHAVMQLLVDNGHYLNFDYEASLKGKGRNSDVKVETLEDRARIFAKDFTLKFKDKTKRKELPSLVRKTPKQIQARAEELMKRPGFITKDVYLKYLDRE